jgi:hypothetical protein
MTLNKVEERILERNLKSLNRECKTCISLLNRDIRKIEDEFNSKQISVRYTSSVSQTRIQQMNKQNQMLKSNYFSNLNKLQNFNVSKTSTPREETTNQQAVVLSDRRIKKNLSANARLSNASQTLPPRSSEAASRNAFSAIQQQRQSRSTKSVSQVAANPNVKSHFLTSMNVDNNDDDDDDSSTCSSSSTSSLNINRHNNKTGDSHPNILDLDNKKNKNGSPSAILHVKAPISISRNRNNNAQGFTKRRRSHDENDDQLTTAMTHSEYFADIESINHFGGRNEFIAQSQINSSRRGANSQSPQTQSPISLKSMPLLSESSSSIGSSANSSISQLPQILPNNKSNNNSNKS